MKRIILQITLILLIIGSSSSNIFATPIGLDSAPSLITYSREKTWENPLFDEKNYRYIFELDNQWRGENWIKTVRFYMEFTKRSNTMSSPFFDYEYADPAPPDMKKKSTPKSISRREESLGGNLFSYTYIFEIDPQPSKEWVIVTSAYKPFPVTIRYANMYSQCRPVPEPGTMLLFGIGIAGLAGARLRRKK